MRLTRAARPVVLPLDLYALQVALGAGPGVTQRIDAKGSQYGMFGGREQKVAY